MLMIVQHGPEMRGKVDHIPGLFYIATLFQCASGLPVYPIKSYLIFDGSDKSRGVELPMHLRSVVMAYVRGGLIVLLVFFGILCGAITAIILHDIGVTIELLIPAAALLLVLVLVALLWLTYRMNRYDEDQAPRLLARAGLDADFVQRYMATPTIPTDDYLASFSPGTVSNQTNASAVQPKPVALPGSDATQGNIANSVPISRPDASRDRFSKDTHS